MLSSTVKKENDLLTVDLATPDLKDQKGEIVLQRGTLHVFRTKFLWRSCCYERLRISNFATTAVEAELALSFSADYADIFEVRGAKRERRGTRLEPVVERARVTLGYEGLDRVVRRTRLAFDPVPDDLTGAQALYHLRLPSRGTATIYVKLSCDGGGGGECAELDYDRACAALGASVAGSPLARCRVRAPGSELDEWVARSVSRPGDDAQHDAARALSVRGRALVQHAFRARRHHHRAGGAVARRPTSRAACWRTWPRRRPPSRRPSATPSRARSCTRRAAARWRRWARFRSDATTAASMRRRCS